MKKTKAIIAILIILCMVLACVPFKVFAINETVTVQLNGVLGFSTSGAKTATLTMDSQNTKTIQVTTTGNTFNLVNNNGAYMLTVDNGSSVTFTSNTNNTDLLINGAREHLNNNNSYTWGVQPSQNSGPVIMDFEYMNQQQAPQTQGNKTATLKIKGGEGSYEDTYFDEATQSEATREVPYSESYKNGGVAINDGQFVDMESMEELTDGQGKKYIQYDTSYNGQDTDTTVNMTFSTLFINKFVGTIKVNTSAFTVSDYLDYDNQDSWLNHRDGQMVQFTIPVTIAANGIYDVEFCVEPNRKVYIGNFLWTSNPAEEYRQGPNGTQELNDDYVAHSRIEFVRVKYVRNGVTYEKALSDLNDLGENEIGPGIYYHEYNSGDNAVEYGYQTKENDQPINYDSAGMAVVEGAQVTLRITPDYGYQVTAFTINGEDVIRGENLSEFTFTVKDGNAHIGARVTKVDNDVKSKVAGITGGSIKLGDYEIATGTARLTVSDSSKSITDEKAAQFKEKIGDGYEVVGYDDISLNQVFFKATGNDEDVWQGQEMENLEEEAEITLQMAEGFDAENTKFYHNVHNGDEIEEVPYTYDAATRNMKFKARTFSNYAFAKKVDANATTEETKENKEATSPKTGDNIMIFASIFAVSVFGLFIVRKLNKNTKKVNK